MTTAFEETDEVLAFLSEVTGKRYPYPKYSQACVANFPFGGMENLSATTVTRTTLRDERGLRDRGHCVRGGKLAQILDHARAAVTVNSTAAQQVLWRGLPLKVFGAAVYAKPEFVSTLPLPDFFRRPARPDSRAYRDYRHYLLETSQIAGGFYSARGRRQLLRQVVDMMLATDDPYDALSRGPAAPRPQLPVVK